MQHWVEMGQALFKALQSYVKKYFKSNIFINIATEEKRVPF